MWQKNKKKANIIGYEFFLLIIINSKHQNIIKII